MERKADDARSGTPFFLYLPYTSPHKLVIPIDPFRGKSDAGAYGDFMIETDWHVGRVLEVLDREQIADSRQAYLVDHLGLHLLSDPRFR